ncbi:LytTR family DNA-binding domain-containing protein [Phenylobacterium sp.]|uniref:LytTR family DNA-binding domain-containing protein n=1 Tax=Phenylobacterium sp. TaxID=1871053 RepID=UPI00286D4FD1|nr:LytTR family DNA-binding domain-containing protein [Phenylobacterium sp.]
MARAVVPVLLRRVAAEMALLTAVGVFMALLGPFGSGANPMGERFVYWLSLILGGGVFGVAIDELLGRRLAGFWRRLAVDSLLMTPAVTGLVQLVAHLMFGVGTPLPALPGLAFQVLVVCIAVMALRQLAWRDSKVTIVEVPAGEPDTAAAFRQRLSARRREAVLLAVQAEDHYLRVHTDAGEDLITLRFADALAELAATPGFRTHRSWWVAAPALDAVRWRRGRGEARLSSGLMVPVSRSHAAALKQAGWR